MSAALSLANQGFPVHLVEKSDALGGRAVGSKFLAALIERVTNHPLITTHLSSKISSLKGHVGNFTSEITAPDGVEEIKHGVVIVATGGREYVPTEYLYGKDPRVVTQRELEIALASSEVIPNAVRNLLLGDVEKQIPRAARNDEDAAQNDEAPTVAMIQCVGSRNEERPFCSRRCCTDAVKNAIKIKELRPDARVFVLYRDMRTYGSNELYYQKAREMGVVFVKYDPESPPRVTGGERLNMTFTDPDLGREMSLDLNLLVLSAGLSPATDNVEISELAKIPVNADGFFLEAHLKLRPVDFASEGLFLCGSAHSPKNTAENIQQGMAAAGRAATILSRETMVVGGQVSHVDVRKCVSCLTCMKVCPYDAPEISSANGKNRVEIQVAKCMGCGSCASACPAKAIQLGHFVDDQISAAIEALLGELVES
jgi:heterodisulfide reductase subunit A